MASSERQAYRKVALQARVQQADAHDLIQIIFDELVAAAGALRMAVAQKDLAARSPAMARCLGLIAGLDASLDMERGGSVAESLARNYAQLRRRIVDAALGQDANAMERVVAEISALRESWAAIGQR